MESHLLITVPRGQNTEFPFWLNYSLVYLIKPNQESFQQLADVSDVWFLSVLCEEIFTNTLEFLYYHLLPSTSQKNPVIFLVLEENAKRTQICADCHVFPLL